MGSADWGFMTGGIETSSPGTLVLNGSTSGTSKPPGGGNFGYVFNSNTTATGLVGLYAAPQGQSNYAPTSAMHGGSVRGAVIRLSSAGAVNFAPYLFAGFTSNVANGVGYALGLGDADPSHIVLRKFSSTNSALTGFPDLAPGSQGVLARSTASYANNTWVHLRLDWIVNTNGDVLLQCFINDLDAHAIGTAPTWVQVPGMDTFVDDLAGINSSQGGPASPPYTAGYMGFQFWTRDVSRRAAFDGLEVYKY